MEFIRYDVCEACLWFIAYGEVPEGNEVSEQEISEAMRREIGDTGGHFACGAPPSENEEEEEYTEFSWHECELCRSSLGGSRHAITLCIPD